MEKRLLHKCLLLDDVYSYAFVCDGVKEAFSWRRAIVVLETWLVMRFWNSVGNFCAFILCVSIYLAWKSLGFGFSLSLVGTVMFPGLGIILGLFSMSYTCFFCGLLMVGLHL